jgi:hypothetical protein
VAVLQGDGNGQFTNTPSSPFDANSNPSGMVVGDFNGDGKPDLAIVNPFLGTITVLQNTASEPSAPSADPTPPASNSGIPELSNNNHPGHPLVHSGSKKKPTKCSRIFVRSHHGPRTKTHTKKCPVHRVPTTHKSNGSASRRRLSSQRPHDSMK